MTRTFINTLVLFAVFAVVGMYFIQESSKTEASVSQGSEYNLISVEASGTSTAKTLAGTLGSVVVENSSGAGGVLSFFATSSAATSSSDLLLNFDATAAEGTYTFDVSFGKGLLVQASNDFDGDVTVTYR